LLYIFIIFIKIDQSLFKLLQEPTQKSLTNRKASKAAKQLKKPKQPKQQSSQSSKAAKQAKQPKQTKQPKQLKRIPSITMAAPFLFAIALIVITAHIMALIMSCFYKIPEDYVNPYRLPPVRTETESYKRYERQQYLDSLKNTKRKSKN
jgi:hypothetical protein